MDGIVRAVLGGAPRDTLHPSCQAWSYAELLRGFNESIYEDDIALHPCAFLHNYRGPGALHADFYQPWLTQAPLFATLLAKSRGRPAPRVHQEVDPVRGPERDHLPHRPRQDPPVQRAGREPRFATIRHDP